MNVIHIVRNPALGGAEVLVKNIINADGGDEFSHYMLYCEQGPLLEQIKHFKKSRLIQCPFQNRWEFIIRLRHILKMVKPDIIHAHQPVDALYAFWATRGLKTKIVKTYHGYAGIYNHTPSLSIKKKAINFFLNQFVSLHFYVSYDLLAYYRRLNPNQNFKRQKILYNGIDPSEILDHPKTNIFDELNMPPDSILMGMVGSFIPARDHYTVCAALKNLIEDNYKVHFLFVGGKVEKYKYVYNDCQQYCIKNHLVNNIHFLETRKDVGGLLKSMDIYVHSSNNDTFGLALVEAMVSGVPCVASDIPTFREVSDNGRHVRLFEKGNADDLTIQINGLLTILGSKKCVDECEEARGFAIKNFSIGAHLETLHSCYQALVSS